MRKNYFKAVYDFGVAVALSLITGVDRFSFNGFTLPLSAGAETDISLLGVTTIPLPSNAGEALEIISDNPADTGDVQIFALGPAGVLLDPFTITLNGIVAAVPLPGLISRINFAHSISNAGISGTINIQQVGGGTVFANILAVYQRMNQAMYTVPAGKAGIMKGLIGSMRKSSGTDTDVALLFKFKLFNQTKWYTSFGFGLQRSGDTSVEFLDNYPESANGPFDIKITATSSAAGAEASTRLNGVLIDL